MSLSNEHFIYKTIVNIDGQQYTAYKTKINNGTDNIDNYKLVACTSFLPDEYKQCNFIETNGSQYLNSDYVADSKKIFNLTMDITYGGTGTSVNSDAKTIFATEGAWGCEDTSKINMMYAELSGTASIILAPRGKHTYTIDYLNQRAGYDGNYTAFKTTVWQYSSSLPFLIGGWYEGGTVYYKTTGKYYQCRITSDTTQVLNLIPALRLADNKPGMYDLVTKTFKINSGSGEFGYETIDGEYVAPIS